MKLEIVCQMLLNYPHGKFPKYRKGYLDMSGLLDKRFGKSIGGNHSLMLNIAKSMKQANEDKSDRDTWLDSLLARDTGVLFELWKTKPIQEEIKAGNFDMSRGAKKFLGNRGFAYGAAAYVSKEARRAGIDLPMPSPNKDSRTPVEDLKALFMSLDLPRIQKKETAEAQDRLADAVAKQMSILND